MLKTLHKCILIRCTTKIYTAWFCLFYEEQRALPEHHQLQLNYAKMQILQQVSQVEATLPLWLNIQYNIKYLYYSQHFSAKICLLFFFCNLASITVFLGELYILPSHKMPAYPTSAFLISIVLFMWYMQPINNDRYYV